MRLAIRVMACLVIGLGQQGFLNVHSAAASVIAECDNIETDNVHVSREQSIVSGDKWIESATAQIGYKDYALCWGPPFPFQSSSSTWVAIEGPHVPGVFPDNSIIQIGYIKCQVSDACDLSGIPGTYFGQVVYFYAFGNANDINHLPEPQMIGVAASGYHTFEVRLHYLTGGRRQWEFSIDGAIVKILDDSWRTWNRQKVQTGNELWNEGDQLGGTVTSVQNIRAISWYNGVTHTGLSGSVYHSGHCYPWAGWNTISSAWYSTWTNDPHTNC